jgi:hypothetical protein
VRTASLLLLAAVCSAQTPATRQLGKAWLREVLDLDTRAAAEEYAQISKDPRAEPSEREVAAARIVELSRLGVIQPPSPLDLHAIPAATRQRLEQSLAQPTPPIFPSAREAASKGTAAILEFLATSGQLPQLRPLVAPSTASDRPRSLRSTPIERPSDLRPQDRVYALQVLRAELENRSADATDLRRRQFANWQPAPWPQDLAKALAPLEPNLAAWLAEREIEESERMLLGQLQRIVTQLQREDQAKLTALLDRLPVISDRLRATAPR